MGKFDCIVVGGGIIGLTTARELALRGLSVVLLEKGKTGMESSWAAGGILSSMRPWVENPDSANLSEQGRASYERFTTELKEHSGIDPEYNRCGMLIINDPDILHTRDWADKNQIPYSDHYQDYPSEMRVPDNAVYLPEIAQVRVSRLIQALHTCLLKLGVTVVENTSVTSLSTKHSRCIFAQTAKGDFYADTFIVCAGVWSGQLLGNNVDITLKPVLGQMLCMKLQKQELNSMVLDGGHYFIPRKDGHVLIGSTMEHVGFDKNITQTARDELMNWATAVWPDINNAKFVKHWAGLRPATDNGKPYLGQLAEYENVFINAGHFRKGILQAPVCAGKLADLICG